MVEEMRDMEDVVALQKGDIVSGKVMKIEDGQVFVDVGYKFDGVIPIGELSALRVESPTDVVSVGDEIEVRVLRHNDDENKLVLSKKAVDGEKAWDRLEQLFQSGEAFDVKVHDVVKGGLVADVGVRAFIPASLVELHFVEDFSGYKGKTLRVKVAELDREENKVILSQRAVLEEEEKQNRERLINQFQPGQVVQGKVQRITNFGAFVDVGGVDGLVHVSELSWHRVGHPSEVVKEGQEVNVKILKIDPEKERISLSIKEASDGPWSGVAQQFKSGQIVTGVVKRLVSFGAFVELTPGVEGLVHVSQIANRHVSSPEEVLEVGQEVKVKILDVNEDAQRISLSIREAEGDRNRREIEKYVEKQSSSGTGVTLGDMFGDLFKDKL